MIFVRIQNGGSRVERSRCHATQRDDALDTPDPSSATHPPDDHKRVTTLARLLGPRWPAAMAMPSWLSRGLGIPHAWIAGRSWQEGPPRDRGGPPGGKEAGRHASPGPEMAPGCGLRRTTVAAGVAMETGPGVRVSAHVAAPGSASALTGGSARLRGGLRPWR